MDARDAQYKPGEQLAGTVYRVVRHLATGGMGSVYDVEDTTVGKRYVLKTLHPQLVSRQDLAKRMQAEARTLAQLQHPNIVDVVTAGITTDERKMPFYVMERLNGQNLRVVLEKKGSLELAHCCRVAIDVADALEHAHENQVIHRDVKPENIFLHRNANGTTTTKLLDFGIMRLLDRKASHTQGKFIGTLRYASPEQIMGGDLGPATDIYSLGIVIYEMLCGRGPFDEIGDAYAIGAAHAQMPPPPVSAFAEVPPALERLVMQSIAKAPHDRPRDCFTLAGELRRLLRDEEHARGGGSTATAVNPLSSVPATRARSDSGGADPHKSTELSEPSAVPSTAKGMAPPSGVGDQPNTMMEAGLASNAVDSAGSPDDPATAPTVASDPGAEPNASPPVVVRSHSSVNRDAPTRASAPVGNTQRLAQHGTQMDDGGLLAPPEALAAALGEPAPLEVPPTSGNAAQPAGEMNFPKLPNAHSTHGGTGPLAAEARTRPPDRSAVLPIAGALVVAVLLVGGAFAIVKHPWTPAAPVAPATPILLPKPVEPAATAEPPLPTISTAVVAPPRPVESAPPLHPGGHRPRGGAAASARAEPTQAPAAPQPSPVQTAAPPPKKSTGGSAPKPEEIGF